MKYYELIELINNKTPSSAEAEEVEIFDEVRKWLRATIVTCEHNNLASQFVVRWAPMGPVRSTSCIYEDQWRESNQTSRSIELIR